MYDIRFVGEDPYLAEDEIAQVEQMVLSLQHFYPQIDIWWQRKIKQALTTGDSSVNATIAIVGNEVAGCCLSTLKSAGVAKINTFLIGDGWQGQSIGFDLLNWEIQRLIKAKVQKAYVTFAKENFDKLSTFLGQAGFKVAGISPALYRPDSYEVIVDKVFIHKEISEDHFLEFVRFNVFEQRGYNTKSLSESFQNIYLPRHQAST